MAGMEVYKECLAFMKRTGRWPRAQIKIDGERTGKKEIIKRFEQGLISNDLYEELMEEISLFNKWKNCPERDVLMKYIGVPIDQIPKRYQKMVDTLRDAGLGHQDGKIDVLERMESFYRKYGRAPEWLPIERDKLSDKQVIERRLYERFVTSEENKLTKKYIETPLEEIPEEHRETIRRLRAIGVGANGRKLTAMEEYMAFVREYAREPIHYLNPDEDQKREHAIKQRWRVCKAKFTFEKYKGVLLEEIPEEDRQVVADLRQMWLEIDGAHVMEEYFSFLDTHKREPKSYNQGQSTFGKKLSEDEQKEADLAARWDRCFEKQVMDRFSKYIRIPKRYKEIISILRAHGLAYPESFDTRMFIEYVYENGFVPRQAIMRDGIRIPHNMYTKKEQYETLLRIRYDLSEDKKIYEAYKAGTLDEKTAQIYEKMLYDLDRIYQIDERNRADLSRQRKERAKLIAKAKKSKKRSKEKLAELKKKAKNAADKQKAAEEKKKAEEEQRKQGEEVDTVIIEKLEAQKARKRMQLPEKPAPKREEEERAKDQKLEEQLEAAVGEKRDRVQAKIDEREAKKARIKEEKKAKKEQERKQAELDEKKDAIELAKIFIDFVKANGRFPRETIKRQGIDIKREDLTREERTEQLLRRAWDRSNFMETVEAYAGTPVEELPAEYQDLIKEFRAQGFGLTSDEYYKFRSNLTPDQVLRFVKNTRDMAKSKKIKAKKLEQEVLDQLRELGKEQDDE